MQESVDRHVRVALKPRPQKPTAFVVVLTRVIGRFVPSQTSFTVGVSKVHGVPHSIIRFCPQLNTGGLVSTTVIVWLHVEEFVHESVARQTRVAVKPLPQKPVLLVIVLTGTRVTFVPSQRSFTLGGEKSHGVPHSMIRLSPQVSRGGVVSITLTVCVQKFVPQALATIQTLVAAKVVPQ